MDTNKIKSKYCANDKVQLMLSNAPNQIICSKDGFLYLRDKDLTIHKYLSDPQRKKMPFHKEYLSKWHATHLFKYNQIYVKFTKYQQYSSPLPKKYTLSFLYFYKVGKGEAVVAEMYLHDFPKENRVITFKENVLEDYLFDSSVFEQFDHCKGKYIFDWTNDIKYAKSSVEDIIINNTSFKDLLDTSNNKTSSNILVAIYEKCVKVFEFKISSRNDNGYNFECKQYNITPDLLDILTSAVTSDYTSEPFFVR